MGGVIFLRHQSKLSLWIQRCGLLTSNAWPCHANKKHESIAPVMKKFLNSFIVLHCRFFSLRPFLCQFLSFACFRPLFFSCVHSGCLSWSDLLLFVRQGVCRSSPLTSVFFPAFPSLEYIFNAAITARYHHKCLRGKASMRGAPPLSPKFAPASSTVAMYRFDTQELSNHHRRGGTSARLGQNVALRR